MDRVGTQIPLSSAVVRSRKMHRIQWLGIEATPHLRGSIPGPKLATRWSTTRFIRRHHHHIPGVDPIFALAHRIARLIVHHQVIALGAVIGLEEVGVPLPVPGDVFLLYAGYLVSRGRLAFWPAVLSVDVGAVIGSSVLYWLARKLGSDLVLRYGAVIHLNQERIDRVDRLFERFGFPVIVLGRYVPGMRVVLTALCGLLRVSYPIFVASVAVSAFFWAVVLLLVGERMGRHAASLLHVKPAHLIPGALLVLAFAVFVLYARRRSRRLKADRTQQGIAGRDETASV